MFNFCFLSRRFYSLTVFLVCQGAFASSVFVMGDQGFFSSDAITAQIQYTGVFSENQVAAVHDSSSGSVFGISNSGKVSRIIMSNGHEDQPVDFGFSVGQVPKGIIYFSDSRGQYVATTARGVLYLGEISGGRVRPINLGHSQASAIEAGQPVYLSGAKRMIVPVLHSNQQTSIADLDPERPQDIQHFFYTHTRPLSSSVPAVVSRSFGSLTTVLVPVAPRGSPGPWGVVSYFPKLKTGRLVLAPSTGVPGPTTAVEQLGLFALEREIWPFSAESPDLRPYIFQNAGVGTISSVLVHGFNLWVGSSRRLTRVALNGSERSMSVPLQQVRSLAGEPGQSSSIWASGQSNQGQLSAVQLECLDRACATYRVRAIRAPVLGAGLKVVPY